jgi:hypothetical protein
VPYTNVDIFREKGGNIFFFFLRLRATEFFATRFLFVFQDWSYETCFLIYYTRI